MYAVIFSYKFNILIDRIDLLSKDKKHAGVHADCNFQMPHIIENSSCNALTPEQILP